MTGSAKTEIPAVVKTIVVNCSPKDAFGYFTEDIGTWWPLATHSVIGGTSGGSNVPQTCVFESRKGGRIFERGNDGAEHDWGTVTSWEPPSRVAFTWHPGRKPETAQDVEVTFAADEGGTLVTLTHTGWEKLGKDAAVTRENYDGGWELVFVEGFGKYAESRANS
jgi:uncharacterized protein YndB with AHSA1/START domain